DGRSVFFAAARPDGGGRVELGSETGAPMLTFDAAPGLGGQFSIMNQRGVRHFAVGAREHGGLLNIMNTNGTPVFIAGSGDESTGNSRGGGLTIRNGRGVQVFYAGPDAGEHGELEVWDADGRR